MLQVPRLDTKTICDKLASSQRATVPHPSLLVEVRAQNKPARCMRVPLRNLSRALVTGSSKRSGVKVVRPRNHVVLQALALQSRTRSFGSYNQVLGLLKLRKHRLAGGFLWSEAQQTSRPETAGHYCVMVRRAAKALVK